MKKMLLNQLLIFICFSLLTPIIHANTVTKSSDNASFYTSKELTDKEKKQSYVTHVANYLLDEGGLKSLKTNLDAQNLYLEIITYVVTILAFIITLVSIWGQVTAIRNSSELKEHNKRLSDALDEEKNNSRTVQERTKNIIEQQILLTIGQKTQKLHEEFQIVAKQKMITMELDFANILSLIYPAIFEFSIYSKNKINDQKVAQLFFSLLANDEKQIQDSIKVISTVVMTQSKNQNQLAYLPFFSQFFNAIPPTSKVKKKHFQDLNDILKYITDDYRQVK